ncbi:hypothetical protein FKM82_012807 [Ascaphus truei]
MNYHHTDDIQCQPQNPMDLFYSGHTVKICAPMVRYSKLAFRALVRKYGCDLCYTPMIVAADFVKSVKARDSEFTTNQGDQPLIVQFAAKEAQVLADAALLVCPFANGIDLNCGCPQRWAMAEGIGACLINRPELVSDMVRQIRNQVNNPRFSVSIKIRYNVSKINASRILFVLLVKKMWVASKASCQIGLSQRVSSHSATSVPQNILDSPIWAIF